MHPTLLDRCLVALQRVLPARLAGRCVHWLSRQRAVWLKNALIRGFVALFRVATDEADRPVPEGYPSFNAFFTRRLRPGARPLATGPDHVLSPVDGTLAQFGRAARGRLVHAKGIDFTATELLGDAGLAEALADAPFASLYLAPWDYHRVHMPFAGRLRATRHIPGRRFSVNARTVSVLPRLYAINERLVCHFDSDAGPFALVLVGALNVASITTAWAGELAPPRSGPVHCDCRELGLAFDAGDYVGHFNLGSTAVLLGPPGSVAWASGLEAGATVRMGELLGRRSPPSVVA